MIRRPPSSTRTDTLLPYTTLFRSLLGTHQLSERIAVDWGVSANTVGYAMPDRVQNTLRLIDGEGYVNTNNADTDNNRFNQRLDENEYAVNRSEEHTSELQSLMRISYAVFCLQNKNNKQINYK